MNIKNKKQSIAFFDFDGTLTTKDTLKYFAYYTSNLATYILGMATLLPVSIKYLVGATDRTAVFKKFISRFYDGRPLSEMERKAEKFCKRKVPLIINNEIYKHFVNHIEADDKVVVVSASLSLWLKPWCRDMGAELLASEIKISDGKLTGELEGDRCYGINKVTRIKEAYTLENYKNIYAYGDTKGDREMLELADIAYYKNECIKNTNNAS